MNSLRILSFICNLFGFGILTFILRKSNRMIRGIQDSVNRLIENKNEPGIKEHTIISDQKENECDISMIDDANDKKDDLLYVDTSVINNRFDKDDDNDSGIHV